MSRPFLFLSAIITALLLVSCKSSDTTLVSSTTHSNNHTLNSTIISAKKEILRNNLKKAEDLLNKVILSDSNYSTAYYELGNLCYASQRFNDALAYGKRAYSLDSENFNYFMLYVRSLTQIGEVKDVVSLYRKGLSIWVSNYDIWFDLFNYLNSVKEFSLLEDELDRFETRFGFTDDILVNRVSNYLQMNQKHKAETYLRKVLQENPRNMVARKVLADMFIHSNDIKSADEQYNILISNGVIDRDVLVAKLQVSIFNKNIDSVYHYTQIIISHLEIEYEVKMSLLIDVARIFQSDSRNGVSKMREFTETLYSQYPDKPEIRHLRGNMLIESKQYEEALVDLLYSARIQPNNVDIWLVSLHCINELKDYDRLVEVADSALMYFPNRKELYLYRGYANEQKEDFEDAYNSYKQALKLSGKLDQDRSTVLHMLASVCASLNRFDETYALYDEVLLSNSNDLLALNNYAYFLSINGGDLRKAHEMSLKTIKAEPNNNTYLDTYGYILFLQRDFVNARKYIEAAIRKGSLNNGEVLEHYGDVLYMCGEHELAISTWKDAKSKGYTSKTIDAKILNGFSFDE